jgi:hypothetical protein
VPQPRRRFQNHFQNAGEILRDIIIPEAKFSHAALAQPSGPPGVANFARLMLATVEFDRKAQLGAIEIDDNGSGGVLTPKA